MSKPKILVVMQIEQELKDRLEAAGDVQYLAMSTPLDEVKAALADRDGLLGPQGRVPVNDEWLDAAPNLKVVATSSVGYDAWDVDSATRHGVAVCNTPGVLTAAVADMAVVLIISIARRFFPLETHSRSGAWGRREALPPLGHDINGKTLGVLGFGRIGREVARRMQMMGMKILWYDVFDQAPDDAPEATFRPLDDLLRESDFVTLHTDLNQSSRHVIGERELGLMKETAYLINTSRGPTVDQKALTKALENDSIAGAALDVLDPEPPEPDEPIVKLPNVITFPHAGTHSEETRAAMRSLAVDNVIAVVTGEQPPACVNPEVLS